MKKGKNNKGRPKKVTSILGTDREQNYRIWSIKEIMKNWFIFKISVQFHFTFMYFSIDVHLKSKIQHQQRASIIQVSSAPPIKLINVHLIWIFLHTPPPPSGIHSILSSPCAIYKKKIFMCWKNWNYDHISDAEKEYCA